jgi:hypothetical protein
MLLSSMLGVEFLGRSCAEMMYVQPVPNISSRESLLENF